VLVWYQSAFFSNRQTCSAIAARILEPDKDLIFAVWQHLAKIDRMSGYGSARCSRFEESMTIEKLKTTPETHKRLHEFGTTIVQLLLDELEQMQIKEDALLETLKSVANCINEREDVRLADKLIREIEESR
jgi:hypothetical protein